MKQFETGKTYFINGGGTITVIKRTPAYITFTAAGTRRPVKTGRKGIMKDDLFGLGENILIDTDNTAVKYFCFAEHEETR